MSEVNWDDLVEVSDQPPLWSGVVKVAGGHLSVYCWWQAWRTARFDLGFTARVGVDADESVVREAVAMVDGLTAGLVSELVVPSLKNVSSWTMSRRPVEVTQLMDVRSVRSKVVLKVNDGKLLEPVMSSMNRFALDLGWTGKALK